MPLATTLGITTAKKIFNLYDQRKRDRLINLLSQGGIKLTDSQIKNDKVIGSTIRTITAVQQAVGEEKICTLENLYLNGIHSGVIENNNDLYLELLSIVADLSHREMEILVHINTHFVQDSGSDENNKIYNPTAYVADKLDLKNTYVQGLFNRLMRTGLILSIILVNGGIKPYPSGLYKELITLLNYNIETKKSL